MSWIKEISLIKKNNNGANIFHIDFKKEQLRYIKCNLLTDTTTFLRCR